MEQRSEPRFQFDGPVRITLLTGSQPAQTGRVVNVSGKGMRLLLDSPLEVGAPVRVDADDILLLAEVCYCHPDGSGYATGLEVQEALTLSGELAELMSRLLAESTGSARAR